MSGYTPVFDTVFDGTLCGKWPTLPVWLTILPMADWQGHIDLTPEAISSRTGWPMALLLHALQELCSPDPRSRSKDEDGRRLVLIDAARDWGWKVVNIHAYRRKASGMAQIADGRNAEKVRRYKERHRETPQDTAGHREAPQDTNSYSYTDSYSEESKSKPTSRAERSTAKRLPAEFELTPEREKVARDERIDPQRELQKFRDYWLAASGANARKHDWDATWRNWCRRAGEMSKNPVRASPEAMTAWDRLLQTDGAERTPKVQKALEAIGGWSAVRMRDNFSEQRLKQQFRDAYERA